MSNRMDSRLQAERSQRLRDSRKQQGFSLWELAVMVGLLVIGIVAGTIFLKSGETSQRETDRTRLLQAADFAIAAFISEHGRLPCPASNVETGVEDCGTGQKGWLPIATLGLDASVPARGAQQIRYVVYRSNDSDLAQLTDQFNPSGWEKYSVPSAGDPLSTGQFNALDFCEGLTLAIKAGPSQSNAHILLPSSGFINVAYALAEAGTDRDSDGNIFDGTKNFDASYKGFESPLRGADGDYDDRVLARSFLDVANHLSCPQGTRSMDALAQAVETANEVAEQKQDNADAARIATIVESVKALLSAADIAGGVLTMVAAVTALSVASAGVATNAALCAAIITAPVGCPLLATFSAALAVAIAAVVAAGVAIAASTAALALQIVTAVKTSIVAKKAAALAEQGNPTDLAGMIEQMRLAYEDAKARAATDLAKSNADRTAANNALTAYNNSVDSVYATAHLWDPAKANDPELAIVLQNYKDYNAAFFESKTAESNADSAKKKADALEGNVNTAKAEWDTAAAITPSTPENIIATTKAVADAAAAAETAAKAAAAADPGNATLAKAAADASMKAAMASIDAGNARLDPTNYVANKKKAWEDRKKDWEDAKLEATNLAATAATKKAIEDSKAATYNNSVDYATTKKDGNGNYYYDQAWNNPFGCLFDSGDHPENCYSYVKLRLYESKIKYNDWVAKEGIAVNSKKLSDESAKAEADALKSYNDIKNTPSGGDPTATGISLLSGAAAILEGADTKGTVK
ncbi:type II secretion system protein [Undibacterium fentianense]|uniref:Prepilin-type N-terminal cleavage/methylation domain-containing protein n=1 Tax=Undibacterium fentianense TaxID=2828728 RepID=A0A941E0B9_9BURK|nr:hypothetical protein [Undibacterium fentianense]MBR7800859.1 hypothetical protein [Undibacterium fentianense]